MKKFLINKSFGFTLIELLVVIAILGILSTIAIGNFRSSQIRGRDVQRKSDLKQISTGLEIYYNDHGQYPPANGSGQIMGCPATTGACTWGESEFSDSRTVFIKVLQTDPAGGDNYCYKTYDSHTKYKIYARLENPKDQDCMAGTCATAVACGSGSSYNFAVTSTNTTPTDATPVQD